MTTAMLQYSRPLCTLSSQPPGCCYPAAETASEVDSHILRQLYSAHDCPIDSLAVSTTLPFPDDHENQQSKSECTRPASQLAA
eukprot:18802-Heterococcus_DN1.PRE.2